MTSGPKRSSLARPTPETPARSSTACGSAVAMPSSVASLKITNAGLESFSANALRQAFNASKVSTS